MTRRVVSAISAVILCATFLSAQSKPDPAPRQPATPWEAKGEPVTTRSGLQYWDLALGDGFEAVRGKRVKVHYSGFLTNGQKFDSSVDKDRPLEFRLGDGVVIRGWDEGIAGMKIGGKRKLRVPPHLGYGADGMPGAIPRNATLVFDVELLAVR